MANCTATVTAGHCHNAILLSYSPKSYIRSLTSAKFVADTFVARLSRTHIANGTATVTAAGLSHLC